MKQQIDFAATLGRNTKPMSKAKIASMVAQLDRDIDVAIANKPKSKLSFTVGSIVTYKGHAKEPMTGKVMDIDNSRIEIKPISYHDGSKYKFQKGFEQFVDCVFDFNVLAVVK